MKKRTKIVGAVLATVLTVSLVSVVAVSAEGRTGGRLGGMAGGIVEGMRGRMGGSDTLAEALGLTQEELRAAFDEGQTIADLAEEQGLTLQELWDAVRTSNAEDHREAIQDRVDAGDMTQEQADWILEGLDNDWEMGMREVRPARTETNPMESAADELGLTVQELRLQLWGGATLEELFEAAGLDWDAYQEEQAAEHEQALRDAITQAVTDGAISDEQADWLLRGLDAGYLAGPQAGPVGRPEMGRPGMGRPGMGGMRGNLDGERIEGEFEGMGGMRGGARPAPEQTIEADGSV